MRTKNQTPFPFGFKIGARRPPQRELTFIVRGTFVLAAGKLEPVRTPRALPEFAKIDAAAEGLDRLAQGSLEADRFAVDDEERRGEVLYPSDFADWKKNAEVMVRGYAHAHGRTERELQEAKVPYEVGHCSFKNLARAQMTDERVGVLKIIFHAETMQVLGVHCFGDNASEIVHIGQTVMAGSNNDIRYFTQTTFNYPTMAEAYRVAAYNGINRLT